MKILINDKTIEDLRDLDPDPDELIRALGHIANALEEVGIDPMDHL
jgi:hypothetical protein